MTRHNAPPTQTSHKLKRWQVYTNKTKQQQKIDLFLVLFLRVPCSFHFQTHLTNINNKIIINPISFTFLFTFDHCFNAKEFKFLNISVANNPINTNINPQTLIIFETTIASSNVISIGSRIAPSATIAANSPCPTTE